MFPGTDRLVLRTLSTPDNEEGGCRALVIGSAGSEADNPRKRATVSTVLQGSMTEFFHYYVKGRVFEWTMALAMLFAGLELLVWNNVLTFGAFRFMLLILDQKWVGTILLFLGWIRISSLMFNGQLLFGRKMGWGIRAGCSVVSASILAQFWFALLQLSIDQGFPSIGLPFWLMFTLAELLTAYSIGAQWKK